MIKVTVKDIKKDTTKNIRIRAEILEAIEKKGHKLQDILDDALTELIKKEEIEINLE